MANEPYLPDQALGPPSSAKESQDQEVPIGQIVGQILGLLKKYFWVFIITSTLAITAAYFYTQRQPRIYQADAKLIFHQSDNNIFGKQIERVDLMDPGGRFQFERFWNTQKEVLNSREFAERVARRGDLLSQKGFVPTKTSGGEPIPEEKRLGIAAGRVRSAISTTLRPNSRVVVIKATTTDPELAQALANAYANAYIDYTREFQSGGLNQMITWFDNYVAGKRKELSKAQQKLHEFKRDKGILSISFENRQGLTGENMATINAQLNQVKTELAHEESLLTQIEQMEARGEDMRALGSLVNTGGAEKSSGGLGQAIQREALLREQIAKLKGRGYLDEHPDVRAAQAELDKVTEHIDAEIERIKSGARNRAQALRRERDRLNSELAALKSEAFELDAMGVQYGQLKDNAENLKELFQTVLKRSEELDINSMYESKNVQVLEEATEPSSPISPNLPLNLAIGLGLGLGIGAAILALIYALDNTIRSEADIARYTDRPVLGALPSVDRAVLKELTTSEENPLDLITYIAPKSSFSEGIKSLRTNLMFMAPDQPPRLLLVTSPGPSEGKTLICTNMAVAMAQSGLKTLVIDSDMRRPRIHKALGVTNGDAGLSSLITGQVEVDDAIQHTVVDNLDVITCGPVPPNPSELLHAERFDALVEDLMERYDRVIFDSPPLGAVSDALVLSHTVDGVLLITKFGQTRKELLRRSIEQLDTVGAPLMGCVLNDIDASSGVYGGSYYYYYRYNYDERGEEKRSKRGEAA